MAQNLHEDQFTISDEDLAAINEFSAELGKLCLNIQDKLSKELRDRPDQLGSVVAIRLMSQAWRMAAIGRLLSDGIPRPEKFAAAAQEIAEGQPVGEMIIRGLIHYAEKHEGIDFS